MKVRSSIPFVRRGFTLVELLVVLAIVVLLAGLVVGILGQVGERQARKQVTLQLGMLESALVGLAPGQLPVHPVEDGTQGSAKVFEVLFGDPVAQGQPPVLPELDPSNDPQGWLDGQTGTSGLRILDPWGREFHYRTNDPADPGRVISSNPDFDLWSAGPDGRTSVGADGVYDSSHPDNLDDIWRP